MLPAVLEVAQSLWRKVHRDKTPSTSGVILSYPRSGNHLVRFYVEFVTGKPTLGCINNPRDVPLCENHYQEAVHPLAHVQGQADFLKYHDALQLLTDQCKGQISLVEKLIVIVRNPGECIARHIGYQWSEPELIANALRWQQILQYFDVFSGQKHLVRYERLIDHATKREELEALIAFIGANTEHNSRLLDSLDYYTEACRHGTNRAWLGSVSNDQSRFHIEKIARKERFTEIVESITVPR